MVFVLLVLLVIIVLFFGPVSFKLFPVEVTFFGGKVFDEFVLFIEFVSFLGRVEFVLFLGIVVFVTLIGFVSFLTVELLLLLLFAV